MEYDAIVLAAGYSSRANTNKLALNIGNHSILSRTIQALYLTCEKVVVVGGHHYESVKKLIKDFDKVILVKNEQYDLGMFSSVKTGVKEISNDFFLIPGDYPLVKSSTYTKLTKSTGDISVPVFNKRRGHPIFIKKKLIPLLLEEPITSNLKLFRDNQNVEYIEVEDQGILLDIDTMDDYNKIKKLVEEGYLKSEN